LIPAVLAQLLIQFQRANVAEVGVVEVKDLSISDSLNRTARSIGRYVMSQAVADASGSLINIMIIVIRRCANPVCGTNAF